MEPLLITHNLTGFQERFLQRINNYFIKLAVFIFIKNIFCFVKLVILEKEIPVGQTHAYLATYFKGVDKNKSTSCLENEL